MVTGRVRRGRLDICRRRPRDREARLLQTHQVTTPDNPDDIEFVALTLIKRSTSGLILKGRPLKRSSTCCALSSAPCAPTERSRACRGPTPNRSPTRSPPRSSTTPPTPLTPPSTFASGHATPWLAPTA